MAMEVIQCTTKESRDSVYHTMRHESMESNERQAVRYSEPVQQPDGTWKDCYFIAYPKSGTY